MSDLKLSSLNPHRHLAVVLAAGFGGLAVTRQLGKYGVPTIVLGKNQYVLKSKYGRGFRKTSPSEILDFLIALPTLVSKKPVLFTDAEEYLDLLRNNWGLLKETYLAPFGPSNELVTNKINLYHEAQAVGIPVPTVYRDASKVLNYPVIVKPLNGIAHTNPEILKAYECRGPSDVLKALKLFEELKAEVCIQEVIPGDMSNLYSLTLYRNVQGEFNVGYALRKIRQFPTDYGTGVNQVTTVEPKILEYSKRLLDSVGFKGVAEIEYKYCQKSKDYYIIEVNGRFPWHASMIHATVNEFAYSIYCDLTGLPMHKSIYPGPEKPVVWTYLLKDLLTTRHKGPLACEYLHHLFHSKIQGAIWSWSDIKPSLYFYKYLFQRLLARS